MGADEIEAMRLGQFRATVAEIGIVANRLHGLVELVAPHDSQGRTSGSIGLSLCMFFSAVCVMLPINSEV